ncbi:MerR family transcriptional regulator [Oceanicella actignis]|uniref:MerR family transcriptional regulator n=1 Tax=Oceanicella actignis TaxID=1189325 RepID=UPI001FE0029C|nr:MerR family transcriptional regulator [Oceanicella actignis]
MPRSVEKSPQAFRTISEVAELLDVPAHVLRFWETRFPQIKPVKRGNGRRYYRPEDVDLLLGIREMLYEDGLTIRGAQKVLRQKGAKHVIARGAALHEGAGAAQAADAPARPQPAESLPTESLPDQALPDRSAPAAQGAPDPAAGPAPSAPARPDRARVLAVIRKLEALRERLRTDPAAL